MVNEYNAFIKPRFLEVFCGTMKSGKTKRLVERVDPIRWIQNAEFIFIKPRMDNRSDNTRKDPLTYADWNFVNEKDPVEILNIVKPEHKVVAIDELQFFSEAIISVIESLLKQGKNVLVAGLDLDFKGEPFGPVPRILCMADIVYKQPAVCEYPGCGMPATRIQRLIDGKPAHYTSPLIIIEGTQKNVEYFSYCLKHHVVPGKPGLD